MNKFTKRRLIYRCPGSGEEESEFLRAELINYWVEYFALNWGRAMRGPQGKVDRGGFSITFNPQGNSGWWFGRSTVTFEGSIQESDQGTTVQVEEVWDPVVKKIHVGSAVHSAILVMFCFPLMTAWVTMSLLFPLFWFGNVPEILAMTFVLAASAAGATFCIGLSVLLPLLLFTFTIGMPNYEGRIAQFKSLVGTRWELVSEEVVG